MVRSAKPLSGVALACVLVSSGIQAADTAEVNFTAQISDGTCDVQLSQSSLQFGIHKAVDFQSGATVAMLPLTATVICSGATRQRCRCRAAHRIQTVPFSAIRARWPQV